MRALGVLIDNQQSTLVIRKQREATEMPQATPYLGMPPEE